MVGFVASLAMSLIIIFFGDLSTREFLLYNFEVFGFSGFRFDNYIAQLIAPDLQTLLIFCIVQFGNTLPSVVLFRLLVSPQNTRPWFPFPAMTCNGGLSH